MGMCRMVRLKKLDRKLRILVEGIGGLVRGQSREPKLRL